MIYQSINYTYNIILNKTLILKEDWDVLLTAYGAIQQLDDSVEMTRLTLAPSACRERMTSALEAAIERTQDFTDSAYTSHEHRENILLLWDRVRSGLSHVIRAGINLVSISAEWNIVLNLDEELNFVAGTKRTTFSYRGIGDGHPDVVAVHAGIAASTPTDGAGTSG